MADQDLPPILTLPDELLVSIFSECQVSDIPHVAATCRVFRDLCATSQRIWRALCDRHCLCGDLTRLGLLDDSDLRAFCRRILPIAPPHVASENSTVGVAIGVGRLGCRVGDRFFHAILPDHGIRPDGTCLPPPHVVENYPGRCTAGYVGALAYMGCPFFWETACGKVVPRAVFLHSGGPPFPDERPFAEGLYPAGCVVEDADADAVTAVQRAAALGAPEGEQRLLLLVELDGADADAVHRACVRLLDGIPSQSVQWSALAVTSRGPGGAWGARTLALLMQRCEQVVAADTAHVRETFRTLTVADAMVAPRVRLLDDDAHWIVNEHITTDAEAGVDVGGPDARGRIAYVGREHEALVKGGWRDDLLTNDDDEAVPAAVVLGCYAAGMTAVTRLSPVAWRREQFLPRELADTIPPVWAVGVSPLLGLDPGSRQQSYPQAILAPHAHKLRMGHIVTAATGRASLPGAGSVSGMCYALTCVGRLPWISHTNTMLRIHLLLTLPTVVPEDQYVNQFPYDHTYVMPYHVTAYFTRACVLSLGSWSGAFLESVAARAGDSGGEAAALLREWAAAYARVLDNLQS